MPTSFSKKLARMLFHAGLAVAASLPFSISCALGTSINGYLENPVQGETESGIGVINGWHCTASQITIEIDGMSIGKAGSGTLRPATQEICGHAQTGFSLLYNWNKLPPGQHVVSMYADGVLFDSRTINTVQSAEAEYVRGLNKRLTIPDFPAAGRSATLEWRESKQDFVSTRTESTALDLSGLNGSYALKIASNLSGSSCKNYNLLTGTVNAYVSAANPASDSGDKSFTLIYGFTDYDLCIFMLERTSGDSAAGYSMSGNSVCMSSSNTMYPVSAHRIKQSDDKKSLLGSVTRMLPGCNQTLTLQAR